MELRYIKKEVETGSEEHLRTRVHTCCIDQSKTVSLKQMNKGEGEPNQKIDSPGNVITQETEFLIPDLP